MYNGPPLPPEIILPLGLELEFLISVGAGNPRCKMDDQEPQWQPKHLSAEAGHESFKIDNAIAGKTDSTTILPNVIKCLLHSDEMANDQFRHRINTAWEIWRSPPSGKKKLNAVGKPRTAKKGREYRQQLLNAAISKFDLPPDKAVRQKLFQNWGRQLIMGKFRLDKTDSYTVKSNPEKSAMTYRGYRHLFLKNAIRSGSFKEFLLDGSLPYFSRDEFKAEGRQHRNLVSEKEVVAKITSKNASAAIMITGPGGQGKTRFARQICALVNCESTFEIEHHVDLEHLASELRSLREGAFVALFLDYADGFPNADKLVQLIQEIESERSLAIRLIVCCRASAERTTYSRFEELEPERVILGAKDVDGKSTHYEEWLARKILAHFELLDLEKDCRGLPVIAAFACFLYKSDPHFLEDLKWHRNVAGTDRWFSKRLDKLVDKYGSSHLRLAQIVASIPFSEIDKNQILASEEEGLLKALRDDKWIEWDGIQYTNAHDFFADTIFSRYIFSGGDPTHNLSDVFGEKPNARQLAVQLHSLNRVADHDQFVSLDAKFLVRKWATSCPDVLKPVVPTLIESKLVQVGDIPDFALEHLSFRAGLAEYSEGHLALARIVTEVKKKGDPIELRKFEGIKFIELLKTIAEQTTIPERVLPSFLEFNYSLFREIAMARLRSQINRPAMAFVIGALLIHGKMHDEITGEIQPWFQKNSMRWEASIIFNCWDISTRRAKNDQLPPTMPTFLYEALRKWCSSRRNDEFAHGTIQVFIGQVASRNTSNEGLINRDSLALDPDFEAVTTLALSWLDQHSETKHGIHVCSTLLRLSPKGSAISKYVDRIFSSDENWTCKEASYLFRELRHDPDSLELLGKYLLFALARSSIEFEVAPNLVNYWLAWGGNFRDVGRHFFALLEIDSTGEQIRFLFQSWDKHINGRYQLIQDYMAKWLEANATLLEAHFVFSIWVRADLPCEFVTKPMNEWLLHHYSDSTPNSFVDFLVKHRQLDSSLEPSVLENMEFKINRLHEHIFQLDDFEKIERFAILSTYLGKLPSNLVDASKLWLNNFGDDENAGFLLPKLIGLPNEGLKFLECAMHWLSLYCVDNNAVKTRSGPLIKSILVLMKDANALVLHTVALLNQKPDYEYAGEMLVPLLPRVDFDLRLDVVVCLWIVHARTNGYPLLEEVETTLAEWRNRRTTSIP